jgi:hypothetical protein
MDDDDEHDNLPAPDNPALRQAQAKLKHMLDGGKDEAIKNFLSQKMKEPSQVAPSSNKDDA